MSYNILADVNARAHWDELYWHIPPFIMDWDARKKKLLRELALWSPDIMCLQVSAYLTLYIGATACGEDSF